MVFVKNVQILPSDFVLDQTTFRSLVSSDIDALKQLCQSWFPVEYPDSWYRDITDGSKGYFSIAAIYKDAIIGAIVAEIKSSQEFNKEDADILPKNSVARVAYIMTLGVTEEHQRHGLGSVLMTSFINYVSQPSNHDVRAVYLHVLTTNYSAIRFYERRQFQLHSLLPSYYRIKGREYDGYTYALYVNGGKPPWCLSAKFRRLLCPSVLSGSLNFHQEDDDQMLLNSLTPYRYQWSLCRASSNLFKWFFG